MTGRRRVLLAGVQLLLVWTTVCLAADVERTGTTFYVSKLGDNSDGLSWATAFTEIQTALDAIPDDQGGHRVIVRPDT